MNFEIIYSSGIYFNYNGSLHGAKRMASKNLTHGCGNVTIYKENNLICRREFWSRLSSFGWGKWTAIG